MSKLETISLVLSNRNMTLSVAESCTGGTFASLLTALPGASRWLKEALVVYSIDSKVQRLDISLQEIQHHGVVSSYICKRYLRGESILRLVPLKKLHASYSNLVEVVCMCRNRLLKLLLIFFIYI